MDFIHPDIQAYAEKFTRPESSVLTELTQYTYDHIEIPRMLSGHLQGRFLAMISKLMRPRRIIEVGTYTGYSAICLAEGLAPGGELITLDINASLQPLVEEYFAKAGIEKVAKMKVGDARDILPTLEAGFDLAFIDADKENYTTYYQLLMPKMNPGGVILADNVLWSGQVLQEDVNDAETKGLQDFVKFVAADDIADQILLPIRDGIMMIRKKG